MRRFLRVFFFAAIVLGGGWFGLVMLAQMMGRGGGDEVDWRDGNYLVYAIDYSPEGPRLGYSFHPGILGLVDRRIIAAGSNATHVVVKRQVDGVSEPEYYIVEKDLKADPGEGITRGPLHEAEFNKEKQEHGLPEFQWVDKRHR